ncbi:transporter [Pseudomonas sp. RIT-PI-S]|uniref:SphA family protein n=1 Tax=Pseudomonas sp. RIT-PI-S TaxID=3035295 RepID=UPI0021D7E24A|nr:transporter [Pseudomonas sp. RIT-PI-S]
MDKSKSLLACCSGVLAACIGQSAQAIEPGYPGWTMPPGVTIGSNAAAPPPGLYSFNQVYTIQATLTGPGGAANTKLHLGSAAFGLTWAPGWDLLGGTYTATVVQPFTYAKLGAPLDDHRSGMHNTYVMPAAISWKVADSWYLKAGLGVGVPDGSIQGDTGLDSIGNPWWTFQPNLVLSYLNHGWNITANVSEEFNTPNWKTDYKMGNVLHLDLAATKTIGKWTVGPLATYVGQITGDDSSSYYHDRIITDHFNVISVGGLVGYDFGGPRLNVWAAKDINTNASGGLSPDRATIPEGYKVYASFSFKVF